MSDATEDDIIAAIERLEESRDGLAVPEDEMASARRLRALLPENT